MKKILIGLILGTTLTVGALAAFNKSEHCQHCGELFKPNTSIIEEICDSCFGFNEGIAKIEGSSYFEFEDGTGYYWER